MTAAITPRLVSEEEALVPEPSPLNPETLQGLAARVEAATGPDREIDARIWCALNACKFRWADEAGFTFADDSGKGWAAGPAPTYTASIDKALALVERNLAGKIGPISLTIAGSGEALICSDDPCGWYVQKIGPTPALALLSALLAALANRPEKPE